MTVPGNIDALLLGGQRGYQIERSLRFNSADSAYLNRTPASAGNRRTWTWSGWVKRSKIGSGVNQALLVAGHPTAPWLFWGFVDDNFYFTTTAGVSGAGVLVTNAVFRDTSAWYHLAVKVDTTQATAADRVILYVNNVQQTVQAANYPAQNADLQVNNTVTHQLGGYTSTFFDGYLTEINFIDGQALTPSSFGETDTITGVWKPKKYAGTYGTNGFFLKFADNSGTTSTTLGKDSSGNSNNWTPNNFSVTAGAGNDSMIDTPTPYADGGNGRGNYCTSNPITSNSTGNLIPPINGNLDASLAAGSNAFFGVAGTQAITSGKFYWEITPTTIDTNAGTWMEVGIIQSALAYPAGSSIGAYNGGFAYTNDALKGRSGSYSAYGATWTANDVIGVALDASSGSITFYKNGVSQGAAYTDLSNYNLSAGYYPAIAIYRSTGTSQYAVFNFGQRAFAYTPPSGFLALNTQNLPEPSIKKPNQYFDAVAYSGDNTNNRTITMPGSFQPDLFWVKSRSGAYSHILVDSARGANWLSSNSTGGDSTNSSLGWTNTGFTTNGIIIDKGSNVSLNNSGDTYVAWCWDESATPGFDIVTYTGNGTNRTIAHSLGVAPKLGFIKRRDSTSDWSVYYNIDGLGAGVRYLTLNSTAAGVFDTTYWNSSVWTSTLMQLGTNGAVNTNSATYVAYLWSEVAGFSKFGSYTGNGSSDGPFVFTGMRARYILGKRTDSADEWWIYDTARSAANQANERLQANSSGAELTTQPIDILSNGFKVRSTSSSHNASGGTYIFAAFAESPFKYSLAR